MTLEYKPSSGFIINGKELTWGEARQAARKKIGIKYKESDRVIDLASFTNGDASQNLIQKRDIYGDHDGPFYFFLNYDQHETLESMEVYNCDDLKIGNVILKFGDPISDAVKSLSTVDEIAVETDDGLLYTNLKLTIADSETMGGDGEGLYYFYAAVNIDHLLE